MFVREARSRTPTTKFTVMHVCPRTNRYQHVLGQTCITVNLVVGVRDRASLLAHTNQVERYCMSRMLWLFGVGCSRAPDQVLYSIDNGNNFDSSLRNSLVGEGGAASPPNTISQLRMFPSSSFRAGKGEGAKLRFSLPSRPEATFPSVKNSALVISTSYQ